MGGGVCEAGGGRVGRPGSCVFVFFCARGEVGAVMVAVCEPLCLGRRVRRHTSGHIRRNVAVFSGIDFFFLFCWMLDAGCWMLRDTGTNSGYVLLADVRLSKLLVVTMLLRHLLLVLLYYANAMNLRYGPVLFYFILLSLSFDSSRLTPFSTVMPCPQVSGAFTDRYCVVCLPVVERAISYPCIM